MPRKIGFPIGGLFVALILLGACAQSNGDAPDDKGGTLNGHYKIGFITVDGKPLRCVESKRGAGDNTYGGISCDWTTWAGTR